MSEDAHNSNHCDVSGAPIPSKLEQVISLLGKLSYLEIVAVRKQCYQVEAAYERRIESQIKDIERNLVREALGL